MDQQKFRVLYSITVISYSSINFLNVSFSFVKRFIEVQFEMNPQQIGMADSLRFLGNFLGLILYILFQLKEKKHILYFYCLSIFFYAFFMAIIPLSSIFSLNSKSIVFLVNLCGGFVKAPSWSLLIQLVKDKLFQHKSRVQRQFVDSELTEIKKNKSESFVVWTALTISGNIAGLLLSQLLVYTFEINWTFCLFIPIIITFISALTLFMMECNEYEEDEIDPKQGKPLKHLSEQLPGNKYLAIECAKLLFLTPRITFLLSLVFLLAVHSSIMMFLPLFLFKIGYHTYQGYILAWYNLSVIIGTFLSSYIDFDKFLTSIMIFPKNEPDFAEEQEQNSVSTTVINQSDRSRKTAKIVNFISLVLLASTIVVVLLMPCPLNCGEVQNYEDLNPLEMNNQYNLAYYFLLMGALGFFLGAPLNRYQSNQMLSILKDFEHRLEIRTQETSYQIQLPQGSQQAYRDVRAQNSGKFSKVFIGFIQLVSYFTVMFILILVGYIIDTDVLAFFELSCLLVIIVILLNIISFLDIKLRS